MRVFSVAIRAALPELPLARTQNLTMTRLLGNLQNTTKVGRTEWGGNVLLAAKGAARKNQSAADERRWGISN
jgi:hypothetical protein